ncbi:MAG: glycoside hydrolase, partial [Bacteroidales bacterium]|nr:glycoside hydrolase [Bacteroidales bacterium]
GEAFKVITKKKPDRYLNRPYVIRMIRCQDVLIRDVTMQNSAMWMQHYLACEGVTISGIKVYNHCNQNNDMIDIDGCRNVIISDCFGDTDDDALTFKSTSPAACENITVTNCVLSSHCNAIKFGTESIGGFRNITISNCVIKPSHDTIPIFGFAGGISGISLEIVDGGCMDGITLNNISMDGPEVPLFIRLGNRARKYIPEAPLPGVGSLSNVCISNIIARNTGKTGCSITGIPGHPIRNIQLSNLMLEFSGGVKTPVNPSDIPEMEDHYPECTMFGELPAYAIYIRHAENISISNSRVWCVEKDARPPFYSEDVMGLDLRGWKATK